MGGNISLHNENIIIPKRTTLSAEFSWVPEYLENK